MFEPIRGGTRGGQAEFKWSDVSADKDRENYLGHSVNAPTGRWQKNKDVHWYNRDTLETEEARREEIRKIKEAEEDALSVALGFKPADRTDSARAAPEGDSSEAQVAKEKEEAEKAERKRLRVEKRERKEERRTKKEGRRERKDHERTARDGHHSHRGRSASHSPLRHPSYRRDRERSPPERERRRRSASPPPRRDRERSRSPPSQRRRHDDRPYSCETMELERKHDRRRWDTNVTRDEKGGGQWGR